MAMGIRRPAFQLLSLFPSTDKNRRVAQAKDTLCLMPDQLGIYIWVYLPLLAVSFVSLLVANARRLYSPSAGNNKKRDALPFPAASLTNRRRAGFCSGRMFMRDVRDVAIPELLVFFCISWWTLR